MNRLKTIEAVLNDHASINVQSPIIEDDSGTIQTTIGVNLEGVDFNFDIEIFAPYPFQFHDFETIRFVNKEFSKYDHVNEDGSVCIHTQNCPDSLKKKLLIDLRGLIAWLEKYVIKVDKDQHYEHIITTPLELNEIKRHFLFTDVGYQFKKGDFGLFTYSKLSDTEIEDEKGETYLIQRFDYPAHTSCQWSKFYSVEQFIGFYIFNETPVNETSNRFAVKNWTELESLFGQRFLKRIWDEKKSNKLLKRNSFIPILIGYNIDSSKTHWQIAVFDINDYPNYAEKNEKKEWVGRLKDSNINWSYTIDCTPELFFGRGKLNDELITKKILIIGIGALGSVLSEALTRGGAMDLALVDFDFKEPGNICRSSYPFITGVCDKPKDLASHLTAISPFITVHFSNSLTDNIKLFKYRDKAARKILENQLNEFQYIFDCSTDNDMLYVLDKLDVDSQILSLSISNRANELICLSGSNIYQKTNQIFALVDQSGENSDLFNPIGCWSPTFKASYSDISILVNTSLNEINKQISHGVILRDFKVSRDNNDVRICRY